MSSTVMLDASLLVLLIVGRTDIALIARHRRLQAYNRLDFDRLIQVLQPYSSILASANLLTEASNLARQIAAPVKTRISLGYRAVMESVEEVYWPSQDIVSHELFLAFGLTDAGVLLCSDREFDLVTDDTQLWAQALRLGRPALKFSHWR